ncbi:MAG: Uncharacterized protein G01um101472_207 [Parcubacteria group bacterium Gr01-1014_72]|nr:MAG: Uncharacterized protein G01um101472_207 [Parcubacteria group bacterium Gr01-1014_72]
MMKYLRTSNLKRRKSALLLTLPVVALLAALALDFTVPDLLSQAGITIARPFWYARDAFTGFLGDAGAMFLGNRGLRAENEALRSRVAAMQTEARALPFLAEEANEVALFFSRTDLANGRRALAHVLAPPPRSPYDTLLIDAGEEQGIHVGDLVGASPHSVLGRIERLGKRTALVKLFSTPGETLPVVIENTAVAFDAIGRGGGNFEMKIPREADVVAGAGIFLPGGPTKGMVGIVEFIEADETSSFQRVLFKSPINIFELRFVEVVTARNEF